MANATNGMSNTLDGFNLQVALLEGDSASTNIACAGIATEDTVIAVLHFSTAASLATMALITSEVSITSAGNIQLSTTDTSNDHLLMLWIDKSM